MELDCPFGYGGLVVMVWPGGGFFLMCDEELESHVFWDPAEITEAECWSAVAPTDEVAPGFSTSGAVEATLADLESLGAHVRERWEHLF